MNSKAWLKYFADNLRNRPNPDWHVPVPENEKVSQRLARSFSHFQLGESGEGTFLLRAAACRYADDPSYLLALQLFIREEQEHARLLATLVERHGGALISSHWSQALFRIFRHAFGVRFELQVLVTAELAGTGYYRVLGRRVCDTVVEQVCQIVLRDEAQHIAFHLDRFAADQGRWLPIERAAWAAQFQVLLLVAARIVWLDHRDALEAIGATWREYQSEVRAEAICFLSNLAARGEIERLTIPGGHAPAPASS